MKKKKLYKKKELYYLLTLPKISKLNFPPSLPPTLHQVFKKTKVHVGVLCSLGFRV
jgi:hypothetical protein